MNPSLGDSDTMQVIRSVSSVFSVILFLRISFMEPSCTTQELTASLSDSTLQSFRVTY